MLKARDYVGVIRRRFVGIGIVTGTAAIAIFLAGVAHCDENGLGFAPEYPGMASDGSKAIDVSTGLVQLGIQYYYKVHGEWPASWNAVVADGLCQTPLVGYQLQTIDPDDGSLDFTGDLAYDPIPQADGSVVVSEAMDLDGLIVEQINVQIPTTYERILPALQRMGNGDYLTEQFADQDWLRQFAVIGILRQRILLYLDLEGGLPCTLDDLVVSGLSPVDYESVNPLTGESYQFDGSANDIYYEPYDDGNFEILPVDGRGNLPMVRFTY